MKQQRHRIRERGQSVLEFAVIAPFFLMLVAIVIDVGLLFQRHSTIQHAVREGARYGALVEDQEDIKQRTRNQALNLIDAEDVRICYDDTNGGGIGRGDAIDVEVDYTYTPLMLSDIGNFFGADIGVFDFTITGSSRVEWDDFAGGGGGPPC